MYARRPRPSLPTARGTIAVLALVGALFPLARAAPPAAAEGQSDPPAAPSGVIRFLEDRVRADPDDVLAQNRLAGEYLAALQRTGDLRHLALARGAAEAFGLPTESRGAADTIVRVLERRQAVSRASASRDRRAQEYAAWLARLPIWHRVERGEALSTLATRYNTTVEQLRALNGLPDDRVRIGQRLIVKPQT